MPRIALLVILIFMLPPIFAQSPELAGNNELSLHGGFDFQGLNERN
jgi:hypothetical protein